MNAFADVLFALLLGWVRGFIGDVWGLVTSGAGEGFLSWVGGNWLWIAAVLCIAGTALDYGVWLMRWRPYQAWRMRMNARRLRKRGDSRRVRKFNQGYQDGIRMDWLDQQAYAGQEYDQEDAAYDQGFAEMAYDPRAVYAEDTENVTQMTYNEAAYRPPAGDEAIPAAPEMPERHRRADRRSGARRIAGRLTRDDGDERLIDGLPPLVDKDQAYHMPVYPDGAMSGVQRGKSWEGSDDAR